MPSSEEQPPAVITSGFPAATSVAAAANGTDDLSTLLSQWEEVRHGSTEQRVDILNRISELIERELEEYHKADPDPFDDRHPGRVDPQCTLGKLLKELLSNDDLTSAILDLYMTSREVSLNTTACRLLYNIMPCLETSGFFQDKESLVKKLFTWARGAERLLCVYAVGLLARAMALQEMADKYRDQNAVLVPLMIRRLHQLQSKEAVNHISPTNILSQHSRVETAHTLNASMEHRDKTGEEGEGEDGSGLASNARCYPQHSSAQRNCDGGTARPFPDFVYQSTPERDANHQHRGGENGRKVKKKLNFASSSRTENEEGSMDDGEQQASSTSWSETSSVLIAKEFKLSPLSPTMEQRLILQYLSPVGGVELLAVFMQMETPSLLLNYIDLRKSRNVQLTFDALLCLSSLMLQKKFAAEFIALGGVQKLLEIPRPSMAATGVSLCLYYLAYNQDAMERVCSLPGGVLSDMVSYALWLLESSHASGVCHATLFFSISFSFRAVLLFFDQQDGLRRLINLISTLELMNTDSDVSRMSEDQVYSCRQTARHTCMALRRYFEAHLGVKTEQVKRSLQTSDGGIVPQQRFSKAYLYSRDQIVEMMEFLMEYFSPHLRWEPVEVFCRLSCVPLMLQLISLACDWKNYADRNDTVRCALDILAIVMVVPKFQRILGETVEVEDENRSPVSTVGLSIILGMAEGEVLVNDAEIQKSALQVIINCVCGPEQNPNTVGGFPVTPLRPSLHPQTSPTSHNRVLAHMWQVVQNNNGIKVLLSLLSVKVPITDADLIRALACRTLVGLSRSATIRQIISKLPLFTSGHIQQLMKEPVLQDKRSEHVRFCRYAAELTEQVSGKPLLMGTDVSLARLQKASVVAQSRITFSERELLILMRNHLTAKGLHETAATLAKEANLPATSLCPSSSSCVTTPASSSSTPRTCRLAGGVLPRIGGHVAASPISSVAVASSSRSLVPPQPSCSSASTSAATRLLSPPPAPHSASQGHTAHPASRILFSRERPVTSCNSGKKPRALKQKSDHGAYIQTPVMKMQLERHLPSPPTLDGIVTEYLREQHARCRNPVTTCPPFSLFTPHQCPEPKQRRQTSANFTARLGSRGLYPKYGAADRGCLDRHLIFSRFRPVAVFRESEGDQFDFTCCSFSADDRFLMLGTDSGEVSLYNVLRRAEATRYTCHTSAITHIQPSRDGKLLLTSSAWSDPLSALWSMGDTFRLEHSFSGDHYVEFSKCIQNRVIGTKDEVAHIYDIQTGQKIVTLSDPALANNYKGNVATFDPSDNLALNDGVLWDVRGGRAIHKFDKFNMNISGVFHPNGLEVIINTEIWDLRTFHLLHTIPALDQCRLVFNSSSTVIYGAVQTDELEVALDQETKSPFGLSFRTFDATDYRPIATVGVKGNISSLCTDTKDCYLAIIEIQDTVSIDPVCRLYEVGRQKLAEEGDDDSQDDEDEGDDSSDSDDDLDSDHLSDNEAENPADENGEQEVISSDGDDNQNDGGGGEDSDRSFMTPPAGSFDDDDDDDDDDDFDVVAEVYHELHNLRRQRR